MSKIHYLAGLLDGEGTIGIARNNATEHRSPYISVTSTTPEIMQFLQENFNGHISSHKTYEDRYKPSQTWKLKKKIEVFDLLEKVQEHMLEPSKKERIKLLLAEYDRVTMKNGKYNKEKLQAKLEFEERFLAIK